MACTTFSCNLTGIVFDPILGVFSTADPNVTSTLGILILVLFAGLFYFMGLGLEIAIPLLGLIAMAASWAGFLPEFVARIAVLIMAFLIGLALLKLAKR